MDSIFIVLRALKPVSVWGVFISILECCWEPKQTLRRVASADFSPVFKGREIQRETPASRSDALTLTLNSVVATRRGAGLLSVPALKDRAKLRRRYASKAPE